MIAPTFFGDKKMEAHEWTCRQCGQRVKGKPSEAGVVECPKCGTFDKIPKAEQVTESPKRVKRFHRPRLWGKRQAIALGCLAIVVLVVVFIVRPEMKKREAWQAACDIIEYGDTYKMDVKFFGDYTKESVERVGDGAYRVSGWAKEKEFLAPGRQFHWSCVIKRKENEPEHWEVVWSKVD